jgi:adenylate cyclase
MPPPRRRRLDARTPGRIFSPMSFRLAGIENEYSFELRPGATMVVGRAVNSDCAVVDATVSRRHAEMTVAHNGVQVKDVGSSNGTYVNGVKVDGYFVVPGDTLTFGKVAFRLEEIVPAVVPAVEADAAGRKPEGGGARAGATIVRQVPNTGDAVAALGRHSGSIKAVMAGDADPAEKDRQKLQILLEVSKGLTRAADVDALLQKVADFAFQILEADRCAILLVDDRGQLTTKISRDKRGADAPQAVPQSIARMAVDDKVAVLSDNAGEDQRFTGQSILMQRVRSALCAPLIGSENKVLGVLYVDNFQSTHRFGEADLDFLIAFAGIAAVAIENSQFGERIRREALVRSNFERFFTPHLAARIANSADAVKLGGDKRPVAVLFSDIRGFTPLSETMNPDALAKLLTEYFTEMVECVFRHGGTLDKFIGDAVMAQWGAPLGESDDVDRAMESALDMMLALDQLNERWTVAARPTLQIGIGLNFGEAFAGNIGSERRLEYTVIGDVVNTASRLCSAAGPGEILVSEEFRAALKTPPRLTAKPPMELKGKSQPVPVFAVVR